MCLLTSNMPSLADRVISLITPWLFRRDNTILVTIGHDSEVSYLHKEV
jgi:hypothetical protein